jgi:hypothetical protein
MSGSMARPHTFYTIIRGADGPTSEDKKERYHVPVPAGTGMCYEADEVYRCIRDGRVQSERMPWEESRIVQGWFDEIRGVK